MKMDPVETQIAGIALRPFVFKPGFQDEGFSSGYPPQMPCFPDRKLPRANHDQFIAGDRPSRMSSLPSADKASALFHPQARGWDFK